MRKLYKSSKIKKKKITKKIFLLDRDNMTTLVYLQVVIQNRCVIAFDPVDKKN